MDENRGLSAMMSITCSCTHGGGGHAEKCQLFVPSPENYVTVRGQRDNLEAQAKVLMHDVNDMMGALRLVASEDTSIETVRAIAKAALARLATRGIGDGAGVSSTKAE